MVLAASPSGLPTSVPGLFELEIGNNLTQLIVLQTLLVGPQGWVETSFSLSGLPFGTELFFQAIEFNPLTGALPVEATNRGEGSWVF
jgi:hypothetical protein